VTSRSLPFTTRRMGEYYAQSEERKALG
jgi:hypothetical protein